MALALRTRLAELAKTGLGADAARRWEALGLRAKGLRVQDVGFRVQGLGFGKFRV